MRCVAAIVATLSVLSLSAGASGQDVHRTWRQIDEGRPGGRDKAAVHGVFGLERRDARARCGRFARTQRPTRRGARVRFGSACRGAVRWRQKSGRRPSRYVGIRRLGLESEGACDESDGHRPARLPPGSQDDAPRNPQRAVGVERHRLEPDRAGRSRGWEGCGNSSTAACRGWTPDIRRRVSMMAARRAGRAPAEAVVRRRARGR